MEFYQLANGKYLFLCNEKKWVLHLGYFPVGHAWRPISSIKTVLRPLESLCAMKLSPFE